MFFTIALMLVSNAASGLANSWQLYAAIRFVVGAAIAGTSLIVIV